MKILRPAKVAAKLDVCRATVYNLLNRGELPPPIQISANIVGWPEDQIDEWLQSRPVVGAVPARPASRPHRRMGA
jgi:prophage regulatory protein